MPLSSMTLEHVSRLNQETICPLVKNYPPLNLCVAAAVKNGVPYVSSHVKNYPLRDFGPGEGLCSVNALQLSAYFFSFLRSRRCTFVKPLRD